MEYYAQTRQRMKSLGVSQKKVVALLVEFQLYPHSSSGSLRTSLGYALSGKRTSEAYVRLLDDVNFVLDSL